MNQRHFVPALVLAVVSSLVITLQIQAQDRRVNPGPATQPGQAESKNAEQQLPPEPYLLRPGIYVYPSPYRPDYWSPRIRRFPDYNPRSRGGFDRRSRSGLQSRRRFQDGRWIPEYGGQYGYGYGGGFDSGYGYGQGYGPEAAYLQGHYDADHDYLWYIAAARAGRLLNQYKEQFDQGLLNFRDGRYERAVINLLGAAEKNHANGASRLHAGHALFGLGRYQEAVRLISRAFELSPSLPFKSYDLRDEYGIKSDFDRHLAALVAHVENEPLDVDGLTMLGYVSFFTDNFQTAYDNLSRAAELAPSDMFIPKLLGLARLTRGPLGGEPRRTGRATRQSDTPRSRAWKQTPRSESEEAAPVVPVQSGRRSIFQRVAFHHN